MGTNSCSSSMLPRFLFGALLVGLVCLVVVGSGGGTRKEVTLSRHSAEIAKQKHMEGRDKPVDHAELDYYNYMSKRRVPNGPDPIHNRRAGNSGRPPGQT